MPVCSININIRGCDLFVVEERGSSVTISVIIFRNLGNRKIGIFSHPCFSL